MVHVDSRGNRVGNSYTGKYGTLSALGVEVGTVYCEVIGTMAIMCAAATYFAGSHTRTFFTQLPLCAIMVKHITVNGLYPPPPVMALGAIALLASAYVAFGTDGKGTDYGKYLFVLQMALNLFVFSTQPGQIVKDTWPSIKGGELEIGVLFVGVIQMYAAVFLVLFLVDRPLNYAVAMTLGMGQLYRDVVLNDSGPVGITLRNTFFQIERAALRTDTARMLIPAQCSVRLVP